VTQALNTYNVGDVVTVSVEWTNPGTGQAINPSGPTTCVLEEPDAAEHDLAVVVSGTLYSASFPPQQAGQHWYRFACTGDYQGAAEGSFLVRHRRT
jgi:hypothetical protein